MGNFKQSSESLSSSAIEVRRKTNGIYADLVERFSNMGVASIANAEFGIDFFRKNWGDDFTTHFCYVDRNSEEFNANLFGEILGEAHGTSVGARGNHFSGNNPQAPNQITDLTKTRCSIVLGCPSQAPPRMKDLWHNQLCTLRSITYCDKQQDVSGAENVSTKHIVQMTKVDNGFDIIALTGGLMYTSEMHRDDDHDLKEKQQSNFKKRSITSLLAVDEGSSERNIDRMRLQYPDSGEIEVGATYDYRLMPDFGGRMFAFSKARLVQPNWRNVDGSLIAPWKNYLHLRTGTLVVVNISIRMHVLRPKSRKQPTRRVYQAIINFLKVVADSDIPVTCPSPPKIGEHSSLVSSGRSAAASMLQSIGSTGSLSAESGMSGSMATGFTGAKVVGQNDAQAPEDIANGSPDFSDPEQMDIVGNGYVNDIVEENRLSKRMKRSS